MGKQARALLSRHGGEQMILVRHRRPPGRKLCALADRWSCGLRVAYRGGADSSVQMPQGVENRCQKAIFIWRNEAPIVYGLWPRVRQAKCRGGKAMIWFDAVTTMQPFEISALAAAMLLGPGRCFRYGYQGHRDRTSDHSVRQFPTTPICSGHRTATLDSVALAPSQFMKLRILQIGLSAFGEDPTSPGQARR